MFAPPAGYSSDEDDYDYFTCDSFSTPKTPVSVKHNLENERSDTRFYRACASGKFDEFKEIVDSGFDVNHKFKDGWTPLLLAASIGAFEIVEFLIEKGVDVNYHIDGYTPLMATSSCPIQTAPFEQSHKILLMLLDAGCDPMMINRKRMTALMFAASTGNCLIVKELLKFDNKDAEDNQGWTALFWAVSSNEGEVVKMLLDAGFNCDRMDVRGETPMQCAIRHGHDDIINLLPSIALKSYETFEKERSFDDFFERGSLSFMSDVCVILYGMNSENAMDKIILSNVGLLEFLTINDDKLKKLNVQMPYERYRIISGLYEFHRRPFKLKSIPIIRKNEEMSLANVATSIITACRQFIVMNASLKYLMENAENKDFEMFRKEILGISEKLRKIEMVARVLNERAKVWDTENSPADLITIHSLKKLKRVLWVKRLLKIGIISTLICVTFNKLKK